VKFGILGYFEHEALCLASVHGWAAGPKQDAIGMRIAGRDTFGIQVTPLVPVDFGLPQPRPSASERCPKSGGRGGEFPAGKARHAG
jgi:hypothetical protein